MDYTQKLVFHKNEKEILETSSNTDHFRNNLFGKGFQIINEIVNIINGVTASVADKLTQNVYESCDSINV